RPAVVRGPVDERIAVVHLMEIDRHVGRARIMARRLDVADRAPGGQPGNVRGDVGPARAGVARQLDLSVVAAGPGHALLAGRLGDREDDAGVLDADVVRREAARALLPRLVVEGEIRTD